MFGLSFTTSQKKSNQFRLTMLEIFENKKIVINKNQVKK